MEKKIEDYDWMPIPNTDGYEASYLGGLIKRGSEIVSTYVNEKGYVNCGISIKGVFRTKRVHRLIARAWIKNPENKPQVNHNDGDKLNNDVPNLEWNTCGENIQHAWDTGLCKGYDRQKHHYSSLNEQNSKRISCHDTVTGKSIEYDMITECATAINVTQPCVSKALSRGNKINNRYEVKLIPAGLAIDSTTLNPQ